MEGKGDRQVVEIEVEAVQTSVDVEPYQSFELVHLAQQKTSRRTAGSVGDDEASVFGPIAE